MMLDADGTICSYLGIYVTGDDCAEICGATLPDLCKQGLFHSLLENASALLKEHGIRRLFSEFQPGLSYLSYEYGYSEFLLKKEYDPSPMACPLTLRLREFDRTNGTKSYVLYFMDTPLGIAHISVTQQFACLYGVQIRKAYRGQGYGTMLVRGAMEFFFSHYNYDLCLHVSSTNPTALKLYERCGFVIAQEIVYYCLKIL
jgi:hypothetical protein